MSSTPRLTTYSIVNVIATAFSDFYNTRNDKHICSKGVKYYKNSEMSYTYMFWLLVIIKPIRVLVLAAMLFTLSCGYSRCKDI